VGVINTLNMLATRPCHALLAAMALCFAKKHTIDHHSLRDDDEVSEEVRRDNDWIRDHRDQLLFGVPCDSWITDSEYAW
jgi:hypothetical protein